MRRLWAGLLSCSVKAFLGRVPHGVRWAHVAGSPPRFACRNKSHIWSLGLSGVFMWAAALSSRLLGGRRLSRRRFCRFQLLLWMKCCGPRRSAGRVFAKRFSARGFALQIRRRRFGLVSLVGRRNSASLSIAAACFKLPPSSGPKTAAGVLSLANSSSAERPLPAGGFYPETCDGRSSHRRFNSTGGVLLLALKIFESHP